MRINARIGIAALLGSALLAASGYAGAMIAKARQPAGNVYLSMPDTVNGRLTLRNETTGDEAGVDTVAGQNVNLYLAPSVSPPTPPPPPTLPPGTGGSFGDGWPTIEGPEFVPPSNGKVNRRHFNGEVIRGGTFAGREFGLRFMDCTGVLYIEGATFERCRQGLVVGMDAFKDTKAALHVVLVECTFQDNYEHQTPPDLPAQVGIYYNSPAKHTVGVGKLELFGCVFINNGVGWGDEARDKFSAMYHHSVYAKGNADHVVVDCTFLNSSAQDYKAIGHTAQFRRCAFLGGAIGINIGQDAEQQDKSGRWQMTAKIEDCLFYGKADISNQRLGWGIVAESADASVRRCIFAAPTSVGDNVPAIRCNAVRDYPVNLDLQGNRITGYTALVEVDSQNAPWGPFVDGQANQIGADVAMVNTKRKGITSDVQAGIAQRTELVEINLGPLSLIRDQLRAGTTNAGKIIASARNQAGWN